MAESFYRQQLANFKLKSLDSLKKAQEYAIAQNLTIPIGLTENKVNQNLVNVFVPTTPNPTSGFLLMIPKKDLIFLDVSFEQASKFIVSAGTTDLN